MERYQMTKTFLTHKATKGYCRKEIIDLLMKLKAYSFVQNHHTWGWRK